MFHRNFALFGVPQFLFDEGDGGDDGGEQQQQQQAQPQVSVEQFNTLAATVNTIGEGVKTLTETVKGLGGGDGEGDGKGDGEGDGKGDDKGSGNPEIAALQTQVNDLTEKYNASETERKNLLAKQADDSRKANIRELAKAGGVNDEALDAFVDAKQGQFQMKDGQLTIVDTAGNPVMSATEAGQQIKANEYFTGLQKVEGFWFGKQVTPDNPNPLQQLLGGNQSDATTGGEVQIVTVEEMRRLRGLDGEEGAKARKAIMAGKVRVADQPLQLQLQAT